MSLAATQRRYTVTRGTGPADKPWAIRDEYAVTATGWFSPIYVRGYGREFATKAKAERALEVYLERAADGHVEGRHRRVIDREVVTSFVIPPDRYEDDTCERGTPGCCVGHAASPDYPTCEAW